MHGNIIKIDSLIVKLNSIHGVKTLSSCCRHDDNVRAMIMMDTTLTELKVSEEILRLIKRYHHEVKYTLSIHTYSKDVICVRIQY